MAPCESESQIRSWSLCAPVISYKRLIKEVKNFVYGEYEMNGNLGNNINSCAFIILMK